MDFSSQYPQFAGSHPPGYNPFIPVTPLTPSHSQSARSDDYNASSPEVFDSIPASDSAFQASFDYPQGGFPQQQQQHQQQHNSAFGGPPTPPNQSSYGHHQQQQQQQFGGNGAFNNGAASLTGDLGPPNGNQSAADLDDLNGRGSEEENLTPAQFKRKAQNRAAQRAFRERKERHVKDLEAKLADLQSAQDEASAENERLKRDLQKMSTENEILKATSTSGGRSSNPYSPEPLVTGPMRYSPTDFASSILEGHKNKAFSHRIVKSSDGQSLYAAGAAWDYIINHDLFKRGLVDIISVSERLRTRAVCDGQGPVFSERDIVDTIQLSVANGTDDLI